MAAAFTASVAGLIALTLLPALPGFAGARILGRRTRKQQAAEGTADPAAGTAPTGARTSPRPRPVRRARPLRPELLAFLEQDSADVASAAR